MAVTPNYLLLGAGNRLVLGSDALVMGYTIDVPAMHSVDALAESRAASVAAEARSVVAMGETRVVTVS